MDSAEITSMIINEIEKAFDLGYTLFYINVDDLDNGHGFLRVLARKESDFIIVYEGTFALDTSYQVLDLLEISKYNIKDFTVKWND